MASRIWRRMTRLWPRHTLLPAAPFVLWSLYCIARGERRWELLAIALLVPALAYGSERTKRLYLTILPFGLVGLVYDGMRLVRNVGVRPDTVHLCDLRAHELRLFGITSHGVRMTLHDWLQAHPKQWLDLFFAIPYGTYLFIPLGYAVYLYFRDLEGARRYMWAFFVLNVAGFALYHVYPAAPPWYFHQHGCVVDVTARSYEGANLARVDAILGVRYFHALYGRASDVFGAMPSLHVAYPLLMVLEGWRHHRVVGRAFAIFFYVATCCAAVYLDHHWVLDVVAGSLLTVLTYGTMSRAWVTSETRPDSFRSASA